MRLRQRSREKESPQELAMAKKAKKEAKPPKKGK